ncbi:F-box/LRR-repeat protein 6 [Rhineura floridana]|uniref:F-box/LRR-repeat protein 6 n=1 Tax=Rhineura floridana TaxID=261503 RepID=UPI002AC8440F|nr:F-box/LRR-repeat protein 6 [Rhineura floridana]XP_061463157.1 F-box/LRR-repeat protein 6 [Rhineura floridana]XP_061463158.1 F-box/LRR-repeat protein 6 [Rhineura floridana]XP_061463159.1 F-box/LRR-repeat protein 6 [Rhineura floridana]
MDEEPRGSELSSGMPPASLRRAPRKRGSGNAGSARQTPVRKKKKAARKAPRRTAPHYLVHETDNDMLLIISNVEEIGQRSLRKVPKKKGRQTQQQQKRLKKQAAPRRRRVEGETLADQQVTARDLGEDGKASPLSIRPATGGSWGEHLPVEILVQIFHYVVELEGSVPFLCRVARVCRLWYGAASSPVLWHKVSIGHCWVAPGQKRSVLEKKVLDTMDWLVTNRLSHLRDFTLCHWKSHVPFVLKAIGKSCSLLTSLKLSHCSGVTTESLCTLAGCCPQLESLNLQNSQVDPSAVVKFLEAAGSRIRHLWLTYSSRMSSIISVLLNGSCPELQLLEVNTEIEQSTQNFQLPIEQLQVACPQLQVLRLLNLFCYSKPVPCSVPHSPGFPQLEELCLATTSFSFVDDSMLKRILCTSSRLRVLDLRGCFRVTPKGLELLPCPDLEQLYLGLYCSDNHLHLPLQGSPLITWKWNHSLRELDLTGQSFREADLEEAMAAFTQEESTRGEPVLRSLNLTGTKTTLPTVSTLIASCPALSYLNLSSCRHLPRGMKKVYRGYDEIRRCLHQLLTSLEETARPGNAT